MELWYDFIYVVVEHLQSNCMEVILVRVQVPIRSRNMDDSQNKNAVGRAEARSAPCHPFNRAVVLTRNATLVAQYSVSHRATIVFSWSPLHPTSVVGE